MVLDLIGSARIAWGHSHRVLNELSDAIPADALPDVARWYSTLDLDDYHRKWTPTFLQWWGDVLFWSPNAVGLIDVLKPALIEKASVPACWGPLHGTLCAAVIQGDRDTSEQLLDILISADNDKPHFEHRFSILRNVARNRPEFAARTLHWLEHYVTKHNDAYDAFLLRHINAPEDTPIEDPKMRQWIEDELTTFCKERLEEQQGTFTLGTRLYHEQMYQLSWPVCNPDLVEKLITVVDKDYVPFSSKSDPIACLAVLALRCAPQDCVAINTAAIRWLESGIPGRALGGVGPLSTAQIRGMGPSAIDAAFSYLLEVLAERHFDQIGEKLSRWIVTEGTRRPGNVVNHTLCIAFHSSFGTLDEPSSVALTGIAEAIATLGMQSEPKATIEAFYSAVLDRSEAAATRQWLSKSAGQLCLDLWEKRLAEASRLADPNVRKAVAAAIKRWNDICSVSAGMRLSAS